MNYNDIKTQLTESSSPLNHPEAWLRQESLTDNTELVRIATHPTVDIHQRLETIILAVHDHRSREVRIKAKADLLALISQTISSVIGEDEVTLKEHNVVAGSIDPSSTGTLPERSYTTSQVLRNALRTEQRATAQRLLEREV